MTCYTPGVGVNCAKNGVYFDYAKFTDTEQVRAGGSESFANVMGTIKYTESGISAISGLKFKKALYGLWFSDDPIDGALKDKVLGL